MNIQDWLGKDNQLGIDIWEKKYKCDNESFDEWLNRVSGGDSDVKKLIQEKKFLFGGRILANRGLNKNGRKVTYSNCYVITPPEDSIESIFECSTKLARTFSYGGGCGIDISKLAPRGARVNNTAKNTTGAVSFMDLYSLVTGLIGQNGRRGALMISMDCHHPDMEQFIDVKKDLEKITSANISIRFTDDFMNAVVNDEAFELSFTREETGENITKTIKARDVFKKLSDNNWDMGEPGCLFWDRICNYSLLSNTKEFEYAGVNPCAEEPLPQGGSCLLGSINLAEFVNRNGQFDYESLEHTVQIAVRALNDVLDEGLPLHPLEEQRNGVKDWRQIGLGIMGLADMLVKMSLTYGDKKSIEFCEQLGFFIADAAIRESARLAQKDGAFPKCNKMEITSTDFFNANTSQETRNLVKTYGLRNSQLLTIAPTGTLSTMLGISGGIEPIFANSYTRTTKSLHGEDVTYKVYTPIVQDYMNKLGIHDEKDLPAYFITASTIHYNNRIRMQSAWQNHIDASISSTVNLPNDATKEDILNLYINAWESGLKGITVFRDGCSRAAILSTTNTPKNEDKKNASKFELPRGYVIKADDNCIGLKRTLHTGCGSLHCEAFFDPADGQLLETYFSKGSSGGCNNFMIGLSRMISLAARGGVDIHSIIDQLNSCGTCPSYAVRAATKKDTSKGSCCPVAIGNALLDMYNTMQKELCEDEYHEIEDNNKNVVNPCPQCGEELTFEGGCNICKSCGWSKCG